MPSTMRVAVIFLIALALLTLHSGAANSQPQTHNDISNLADELKYLQDLDTYNGDKARARFGKRSPLLQFLHQRMLENPELARAIENPSVDEPFCSPRRLDKIYCIS